MSNIGLAAVPNGAYTFGTNILIYNATKVQTDKILKAQELIKDVISTEEFRTSVLNHSYNGVKTFVDNNGHTNSQIYNLILEGAERLNGEKNNAMDMGIKTYYQDSNTVGYTSTAYDYTNMNTKFLDQYSSPAVARNMMHEWLHKLGFSHDASSTYRRDYSVPYGVGKMVESIAKQILAGKIIPGAESTALTAPTNITQSSTSSNVTIKWWAAIGAVGYKVYRQLAGASSIYLQGTTPSLSYSQPVPTKKATYYVRSVDRYGDTLKSAKVEFDPSIMVEAPTNLTLLKTSTQVYLKWSASRGAVSYKVYRRLEGSTTNYEQVKTASLVFSQPLPPKTAYYYVRSVDASGKTLKSAEVKYTR